MNNKIYELHTRAAELYAAISETAYEVTNPEELRHIAKACRAAYALWTELRKAEWCELSKEEK